jgi:hypothetical protein
MDAEDVDLEDLPPLVRIELPRLAAVAAAGVRDEQVDRVGLPGPALDVGLLRDVADERMAADLRRDRLHLLGRARRDPDVHAGARQLVRDVRADPAAAAGDECVSAQLRHRVESTSCRAKLASASLVGTNSHGTGEG